jgi:hypothetical protein
MNERDHMRVLGYNTEGRMIFLLHNLYNDVAYVHAVLSVCEEQICFLV